MTAKRFTSMYNEQSDMIQYVDTLKEEPNKWSICNVSETLKKLNELHEEIEYLKPLANENTQYIDDMEDDIITFKQKIKKLEKENEELKQRNENQYRQLQHLWSLMEAKDWETLSEMVNQMEEDEKRLQNEWKCYE